jgi:hypothetical protein
MNLILAGNLAAIDVLLASNHAPISQWNVIGIKVQPQVWVSVMSALANALNTYAFAEGLTRYFWTESLRGTTVWLLQH